MQKINLIFFLIFPVMLISFAVSPVPAHADTTKSLQSLKSGTAVYIGIEPSDWPPYEFFQRKNGEKTEKVIGFTVDVVNEIFSQNSLKFEFRVFPWKRCLFYLESGEKIQMILPTSVNAERKKKYLISHRVYTITPSYFYMKKKYPNGIAIKSPRELLKYSPIGGKLGFNYLNFGIKNETVDRGATSFDALVEKLKKGRCNIVLARYEVLRAHSLIGQPYLSHDIGHAPIPGVAGEDFYFMISKNHQHSNELLQIINNGIDDLRSQGRLKEMLKKYLP